MNRTRKSLIMNQTSNVELPTSNVERKGHCGIGRSTFDVRRSAFDVRPGSWSQSTFLPWMWPLPMNRRVGRPLRGRRKSMRLNHLFPARCGERALPSTGSWTQCVRSSEWRLSMNQSVIPAPYPVRRQRVILRRLSGLRGRPERLQRAASAVATSRCDSSMLRSVPALFSLSPGERAGVRGIRCGSWAQSIPFQRKGGSR